MLFFLTLINYFYNCGIPAQSTFYLFCFKFKSDNFNFSKTYRFVKNIIL